MPHLIMCNGERENILRRQKVPLKAYLELWDYNATGGAYNCKNKHNKNYSSLQEM